jgi:hypothetical protein
MWKTLIGILIIVHASASEHPTELKSKYSFGLLTDDYGVLTTKDLALNACHIKAEPFVPGVTNPFEYWLCFESKTVSSTCDDQSFSNEDGHVGRVTVKARDHQFSYDFIESRPWPIHDCKSFTKTLKNLVQGTSHTCISASYISKEEKNERGHMERIGIFNQMKTRKGCEGEECVFTEKVRKEYCPDLKL